MSYLRLAVLLLFCFAGTARAEEIALVFTGNTYASLYDCGHCSSSVGGAISRRATALKKIRSENPFCLVVDAGNFTAGGILDEFHSERALDRQRTGLYLKALSDMGYDALALGDEDFNYGISFLKKNRARYKLDFLSLNEGDKAARPYLLKQAGSRSIAFIGLTSDLVSQRQGRTAVDFRKSLGRVISSLKGKCDLFVLLSNMGDNLNKKIAEEFPEIGVIISSGNMHSMIPYEKIGSTVLCRPAYQGKELRVLHLTLEDSGLTGVSLDQVQLSKDIEEDQKIKDYLPVCFCDADCFSSESGPRVCKNKGNENAVCQTGPAADVRAVVITDTACPSCAIEYTEDFLKSRIPGLDIDVFDFRDKPAQQYISDHDLKTVPSFLLLSLSSGKTDFSRFADFAVQKGDLAVIKSEYSGVCMFLNRELREKRVDIFADLADPSFPGLALSLAQIANKKDIGFNLYFYSGISGPDPVPAQSFNPDEESDRFRAVQSMYPDKFWAYLSRRSSDLSNTWWISLFEEMGFDYKKIRLSLLSPQFIKEKESADALRRELNINQGSALLVGNKYLFRIMKLDEAELRKLLDYVGSAD